MSLWVASSAPNLFSKIICVDGVPFVSALYDKNITEDTLKKNPMLKPELIKKSFERLSDSAFEESQYKMALYLVTDSSKARQIAKWGRASDKKTLAYTMVEMSTTDLRKEVKKIKAPVLIIASMYGTAANSKKLFEEEYKNLPDKKIIVADTKHFIMYDKPEWFNKEIINFLKEKNNRKNTDD